MALQGTQNTGIHITAIQRFSYHSENETRGLLNLGKISFGASKLGIDTGLPF